MATYIKPVLMQGRLALLDMYRGRVSNSVDMLVEDVFKLPLEIYPNAMEAAFRSPLAVSTNENRWDYS